MKKLSLLTFGLCFSLLNSHAAQRNVPADFSTIQAAIVASTNGDVVVVAPGFYQENINFLGKAIWLRSAAGPDQTILQSATAGSAAVAFGTSEGRGSILEGFTIRNCGGISITRASPYIRGNIITNNSVGITFSQGSALVVSNRIVGNVGNGGLYLGGAGANEIIANDISYNVDNNFGGGGIEMFAAGDPIIRNNRIAYNRTPHAGGGIVMVNRCDALIEQNLIVWNVSGTGGGIYWLTPGGTRGPRVISNTIANNDAPSGSGICADGFDVAAEIINNIIVAHPGTTGPQYALFSGAFNDQNVPITRTNLVYSPGGLHWGGIYPNLTGSNGNISVPAIFVDALLDNYQLQSNSPAIDKAFTPRAPAFDFLNVARPIDGNRDWLPLSDLGAYEFNPPNNAPVANAQSISLFEDNSTAITLTSMDSDGDAVIYQTLTLPSHGSLSGSGANLVYTPMANYHGSDSFNFRVYDGLAYSGSSVISLTIAPVNDRPVANGQSLNTAEDTGLNITLTGSDIDGDTLSFTVIDSTTNGTLSGSGANFVYTPGTNFHGPDSFTFKVNDGTIDSATASITISVGSVNDAPSASAQSVETQEDTALDIVLTGNDVEGDALTFAIVSEPAHGVLSGTGANRVYTPAANYHGTDSFTFTVSDGTATSTEATVSIVVTPVNDAPVAAEQGVFLPEDSAVPITLSGSDVDGDGLTFIVVNYPANGILIGGGDTFVYIPNPNFNGVDTFTFKVNDGTVDSAEATVGVVVVPMNDAPVAVEQGVFVLEDGSLPITLTASDVDGNLLTFEVVSNPSNGTLSGSGSNLVYTPNLNFNGVDVFTFKANDGTVDSTEVTVSIVVMPVNDAPTASAQNVGVAEDGSANITLTGSDVDGNALTFTLLGAPSHGTLSGSGANLTYTPNANYHGTDSFTFKVNDGTTDSAAATVSINVTSVNDGPVANAQNVAVAEDGSVNITLTGSDVDGDALTFAGLNGPAHGTLSGSGANLIYTPNANYHGSDSFTFKANDGTVDSAPAAVSINVTPVNDVPSATPLSIATLEDASVGITLAGTDIDGDALSFSIVSSPSSGTLSGTGANRVYTPSANFNGVDSFTYRVNDGLADSATVTVTITVTAVNDAPDFALAGSNVTVKKNSSTKTVANWATNLSTGPANENGQTLSFNTTNSDPSLFAQQPAISANGTLTFRPTTGRRGTVTVTVTAQDNGGTANSGVDTSVSRNFTITVN